MDSSADNFFSSHHLTGTYQQYITAPARYTTRIPDGVSDYIAGPLMCGGLTAYGSLKNSGLKTGNWVVIAGGGGGVGIQAVQLAKAMGFRPVVVDSGEDKRKLGLSRGAEAFVDFATSTDVTAEVKAICDGIGAHGVVVTAHQRDICEVRGLSALPQSVEDLKKGRVPGRIVIDFNQP